MIVTVRMAYNYDYDYDYDTPRFVHIFMNTHCLMLRCLCSGLQCLEYLFFFFWKFRLLDGLMK